MSSPNVGPAAVAAVLRSTAVGHWLTAAEVGLVVRDRRTLAVRALSRAAARLFDQRAADVAGPRARWASLVHPDDRAGAVAALRAAARRSRGGRAAYRVVDRGAGERALLELVLPAAADDAPGGAVVGLLLRAPPPGPAGDDPSATYRTIVDACPRALVVHRDGRVLLGNAAFAALVGVDEGGVAGRALTDFVAPSDQARVAAAVARVQRRGGASGGASGGPLGRPSAAAAAPDAAGEDALWLARADGARVPVEVATVPYRFRGRRAALSVLADVSARRRADEMGQLFASALRASRDAVGVVRERDDAVLAVNEAWEAATGLPRARQVGRPWRALGVWRDAAEVRAFGEALAAHGRVRELPCTLTVPAPDGGPARAPRGRPARARPAAVRHALVSAERVAVAGEPCLLVVAADVTAERRLEAEQRQAQKMEAVGRLAGSVAHDFNNLLTVIGSYAQFAQDAVREALGDGHPGAADLDEVRQAAARARALVRQLLSFSRARAGALGPEDLGAVVRGVVGTLRPLLGDRVTLRVKTPAAPLPVLADRGQLEQVLVNLALNGRDAMAGAGTLVARAARVVVGGPGAAGRRAARDGVPPGAYAAVTVRDTGAGMDAATLERAVEPFFTTKPAGQGTGLGLSTSYDVVRRHGGHLRLASAPGRGTTAAVYLPLAEPGAGAPFGDAPSGDAPFGGAAPPPAPPRPERRRAAAGPARVMVVEDEPAVRAVMRRVLAAAGYAVTAFGSGADALAAVERAAPSDPLPDLVLTDVTMPRVTGPALVAALRARGWAGRAVYVSGYAAGPALEEALRAPDAYLLQKPFTREQLEAAVRGGRGPGAVA